MSILKRDEWPEVGELVIATVDRILEYGAYVRLDEYDKEGLLHISEISSSWIKNIRDHVREGQKVVLKVLRVDPEKNHIDLSLRRVTKRERTEKMLLWKKGKKAESLLRSASKALGITFEEIYEKAGALIEKEFGDIYEGLERAVREGSEALTRIGVPKRIAEVITETAKERIKISMVKVKGILTITSMKPDGILHIKKALLNAKNIDKPANAEINIYVMAAPKYSIEISADDYKKAEGLLKKAAEAAINYIKETGGQGAFSRS